MTAVHERKTKKASTKTTENIIKNQSESVLSEKREKTNPRNAIDLDKRSELATCRIEITIPNIIWSHDHHKSSSFDHFLVVVVRGLACERKRT